MSSKPVSKIIDFLNNAKNDLGVTTISESCVVTDWISTGSIALDAIMGGGIPVGRITEIRGDPSSGKSLIAAVSAGIAQRDNALVGYEDSESTVSREMAAELGVNTEECVYATHDTVEEVFKFFEQMVAAKKLHAPDSMLYLIWDSIAATSIQQEMDADYGKAMMGKNAAVISQSMRKFTHIIQREKVCALFLNQTRQQIGVMYGDNTTSFGGNAVPFHASVRVQLDLSSKIKTKDGKHVVGMHTLATCIKNKVAMPFRKCYLPIYFGSGIDDAAAVFRYMKDNDLIEMDKTDYVAHLGQAGDIAFKKKQWRQVFADNYQLIAETVMGLNQEVEAGDVEVVE